MIQHTVVFKLKHSSGSAEEKQFLQKAQALRNIPNVLDFKVLEQVGKKNNYSFGLSMYFDSEQTYAQYNEHPDHMSFVNNVWLQEVEEFLEIDYIEKQV